MQRQIVASGAVKKAKKGSTAPPTPLCYACHRIFPPRPPNQIVVEYGVDDDGRPWKWIYVPRRDHTSKWKEPWDVEYLKISDARVNEAGDVVFDRLAHTRKATAHELVKLWDLREGANRYEVSEEWADRPARRRAPSPQKSPAKAGTSGKQKAGTSSGSALQYPVPFCPPGCRLLPVVSPS